MAQSKSSQRWLKEHFKDPYVKMAQKDGYRSRASYKLLEVQEKDRILRPGMTVVDLGSAPGGWSQVTSKVIGDRGRLIASDILLMDSIPDVTFIQGDFTEDVVFSQILQAIGDQPVDLVISDMAPNISGVVVSDQARVMHLAELGLDFSRAWLKPDGAFLVKVFQGYGYEDFVKEMRKVFLVVSTRKPEASRDRSPEVYLLGRGLKG